MTKARLIKKGNDAVRTERRPVNDRRKLPTMGETKSALKGWLDARNRAKREGRDPRKAFDALFADPRAV